jgi:hypothetical protein
MVTLRAAAVALVATVAAAPAHADEPETGKLIAAGLGMAPVAYVVGVVAHEGSHAVAATLVGAEVTEFSVIPGRRGPQRRFYFGYVRVSGAMSDGERIFFWLAPKLTDALALGGYAVLIAADLLPENRYGALALTVAATGAWVDFSKDIPSWNPGNDMVKIYNKLGLASELERLPLRLAHAALAGAAGYAIALGYREVFSADEPAAVIAPLFATSF